MGIITIERVVNKVTVFYMNRVDQDGNNYRFYMIGNLVSEIEYFCTEEAGNLTIQTGENLQIEITPKEIERIPVKSYRELVGLWNRKTDNKKGWYIYNNIKHEPDICIIQKNGVDINGNRRFKLYLIRGNENVTRFFKYWRLVNNEYMTTVGYESQIKEIIKERFNGINIIEI